MRFDTYETISSQVKDQIDQLCGIWKRHLGESLVGIYIHGSLALGCFKESRSDIDVLIVTDRKIEKEERLRIANEVIEIDQHPCPLEMSAISMDDLIDWQHPTPCQFHYSDYWTETYQAIINGEKEGTVIVDEEFDDPDIASHVLVTNQSGLCVYGKPVEEVFPFVPEIDFWNSISNDIEDYEFDAYKPKYFASNILILGRILSYKVEKKVLSKYEGAQWTLSNVPDRLKYIVENAMKVWYEHADMIEYDQDDLENLKTYLIDKIKL